MASLVFLKTITIPSIGKRSVQTYEIDLDFVWDDRRHHAVLTSHVTHPEGTGIGEEKLGPLYVPFVVRGRGNKLKIAVADIEANSFSDVVTVTCVVYFS